MSTDRSQQRTDRPSHLRIDLSDLSDDEIVVLVEALPIYLIESSLGQKPPMGPT